MQRTLGVDIENKLGQKVSVQGMLYSVRTLGKISFVILKDRSGFFQVVLESREEQQKLKGLYPGTVVQVTGEVVQGQKVEISQATLDVLSPVKTPPPIEYYKPVIPSELEFILDHRSLALRNERVQAVFKIQAELAHAFRLFMHDRVGATEYFGPNLIGASSEGGAEFFSVDYFGHTATLAQSSQLYKQVMVGVHERVFALMPFFRAEPSHTTRHLTEGKQFEFEMAIDRHWHEILDIQEALIKDMWQHVQHSCRHEIETLGFFIACPQDVPFPRLTFAQAQQLFFERTGIDERNEMDLCPQAEKELCAWALETHGTDFVFITDWLTQKRPFYAYPNPENPTLSNTFDLLCHGVEITSGGQRRHTFASILEGIEAHEMNPDQFQEYLPIFEYGMPPHGGFGMGLERLTQCFLDLDNVRQASLFPSDPKRIASTKIKAHIFFGQENVRNEILRLLRAHEVEFTHSTHEPTPTSQDSAQVRQTTLEQGVKAIIVKGKKSKKNYQFNIASHQKIDMKAVAKLVGEKCEFEDPKIIQERYGVVIGGVPPFGNLFNLDTFVDECVLCQEQIAFNCGLQTESIMMPSQDLVRLSEAKLCSFSQRI